MPIQNEQRLAIITPATARYALVYRFTPGVTRFLLKEMLELRNFRHDAAALRAVSRTFDAQPYLITADATSRGQPIRPAEAWDLGVPAADRFLPEPASAHACFQTSSARGSEATEEQGEVMGGDVAADVGTDRPERVELPQHQVKRAVQP